LRGHHRVAGQAFGVRGSRGRPSVHLTLTAVGKPLPYALHTPGADLRDRLPPGPVRSVPVPGAEVSALVVGGVRITLLPARSWVVRQRRATAAPRCWRSLPSAWEATAAPLGSAGTSALPRCATARRTPTSWCPTTRSTSSACLDRSSAFKTGYESGGGQVVIEWDELVHAYAQGPKLRETTGGCAVPSEVLSISAPRAHPGVPQSKHRSRDRSPRRDTAWSSQPSSSRSESMSPPCSTENKRCIRPRCTRRGCTPSVCAVGLSG